VRICSPEEGSSPWLRTAGVLKKLTGWRTQQTIWKTRPAFVRHSDPLRGIFMS
jgi:hypothetical protein